MRALECGSHVRYPIFKVDIDPHTLNRRAAELKLLRLVVDEHSKILQVIVTNDQIEAPSIWCGAVVNFTFGRLQVVYRLTSHGQGTELHDRRVDFASRAENLSFSDDLQANLVCQPPIDRRQACTGIDQAQYISIFDKAVKEYQPVRIGERPRPTAAWRSGHSLGGNSKAGQGHTMEL